MQSGSGEFQQKLKGGLGRFSRYYKRQNFLGKILVIIACLLASCCLCSVPLTYLSPSKTPTTTGINQQTQIAQIVGTQVEGSKSTFTPEPSQTIAPEIPTPASTNAPEINHPVSKVTGLLYVTFIDVGQGDSILIQSPDGKYGLIDGGEQGSGALKYLQSHGVKSLDLLVATHPHSDHIGGLVDVLKTIPVSRIITNGQPHTTGVYESFLDAALASKAEYQEVKRGDAITLGDLALDVIHPANLNSQDLNGNSIVLRLDYGNVSFLLMGDANKDSDSDILMSGQKVQANIFKVGHHASATSFSSEFISAVNPVVAIYSAGVGNDYDHPAKNTKDALLERGIQVFGTDVNGTISIVTNRAEYRVDKEKEVVPTAAAPVAIVPPAQAETKISVSSLTSPINAGAIASISVKTTPGADCSISVIYKSGPSSAAGLGPQVANQNGDVSWSWKVGSNTSKGIWNIKLYCTQNGKSDSISVPFEVTR